MYYAEFSKNVGIGIDPDCVYHIHLDDVWAKRHDGSGVEVNVGEDYYCYSDYVCIVHSKMDHNQDVGIYLDMIEYYNIKNTETRWTGESILCLI